MAVLGFFDLEEVWSDEVAPQIRSRVSTGAFEVIDATVQEILRSGSGFWLTFGVALAVWEVSAAIRALMGGLNLIYGSEERRSTLRRFAVSVVLAVVTAGALGLAIVALQLGPQIADSIGLTHGVALFFARWIGAAVLMTAVVVMLIRFAPARHQRRSLFGVTAVFVTAAWIGASLVFNWYTTTVAAYQSLFGEPVDRDRPRMTIPSTSRPSRSSSASRSTPSSAATPVGLRRRGDGGAEASRAS